MPSGVHERVKASIFLTILAGVATFPNYSPLSQFLSLPLGVDLRLHHRCSSEFDFRGGEACCSRACVHCCNRAARMFLLSGTAVWTVIALSTIHLASGTPEGTPNGGSSGESLWTRQ